MMKKLSLKKRSKQKFRRRKTMKGGFEINYKDNKAELTAEEAKKIQEIKEGHLKDRAAWMKINEFINYLKNKKEDPFDYDKIDEKYKRQAYEIIVSLLSDRSYNGDLE
jgi:hypothetical protein